MIGSVGIEAKKQERHSWVPTECGKKHTESTNFARLAQIAIFKEKIHNSCPAGDQEGSRGGPTLKSGILVIKKHTPETP